MLNADMIYEAADYLRLSKEDGDFSLSNDKLESDSISSQRAIIERFVAQNPNIKLVAEFCDDGYTGTNFDRPDFQRMMEAVKAGKINCVIVKDLSRFGRDYIDAGKYIEKIFPQLGVRFIAVNDNYDSLNHSTGDSLVLPVKNFLNDSYSRDISIKVRSSFESRRQDGEFIANYTAYGYLRDPENKNKLVIDEVAGEYVREIFQWKIEGMSPVTIAEKLNGRGVLPPSEYAPHGYLKDPSNKNHLIINPETAPVIQQIYQWRAEGLGYGTITRMLNERGIPSPGRYRFEHGIVTNNNKKGSSLLWNRHALTDILRNIVYIGHLAQGKCTASLARGIPVHRTPESEWDIAYHTHDPIITEELFNQVQEINRSRADAYNANYGACSHLPKGDNPYRERLVCADCGTQMKLYRNLSKNHKKAYFTYICPTYEEHQELRCTKKTIRSNALDAMVLKTLKIQMELFCDAQQVLERLSKKQPKFPAHTEENELQQLEQQVKRKQGYATSLYADYRTGLLTREEYTFARGKYQEEVAALQGRISQLQERLTLTSQVSDCAKSWMALIEQYKSAEIVSRELVTAFISEIRLSADGSIKVSFLFQDELSRIRAHCKAVESEVA